MSSILTEGYTTETAAGIAVVFTPVSGGNTYTGQFKVESLDVSVSHDNTIDLSISLKSHGAVTLA